MPVHNPCIMSGMAYATAVGEDKVAEFDLNLVRPGKWILDGYMLPGSHWYQRQVLAMNYAQFRARDCGAMCDNHICVGV